MTWALVPAKAFDRAKSRLILVATDSPAVADTAPPTCLRTAFGRTDSFEAHLTSARTACLRATVLENPRLAFDVDGPEDHAQLRWA